MFFFLCRYKYCRITRGRLSPCCCSPNFGINSIFIDVRYFCCCIAILSQRGQHKKTLCPLQQWGQLGPARLPTCRRYYDFDTYRDLPDTNPNTLYRVRVRLYVKPEVPYCCSIDTQNMAHTARHGDRPSKNQLVAQTPAYTQNLCI